MLGSLSFARGRAPARPVQSIDRTASLRCGDPWRFLGNDADLDSAPWRPDSPSSRRTTHSIPGASRAWSRSAGTTRCLPRAHPHPGLPGVAVPRRRPLPQVLHTYDLFVALTAAAAATTRLRIGTGICLVVERDPIITAKEVASVDHLSGGRFEFGVGAGWNREEMATTAPTRGRAWRSARARRGDEGDLDAGRGQLPRRATSTSSGSGPGRSPPSGPTRRSSSAATARRSSTGCSRSATPGSRTTAATTSSTGSPSCARAPSGRRGPGHRVRRPGRPPSSARSARRPASTAPCAGCRPAPGPESSAALDRCGDARSAS